MFINALYVYSINTFTDYATYLIRIKLGQVFYFWDYITLTEKIFRTAIRRGKISACKSFLTPNCYTLTDLF